LLVYYKIFCPYTTDQQANNQIVLVKVINLTIFVRLLRYRQTLPG